MVNIETFRQMALSLPKAEELPHFDKTSFRVNKRIFATLDVANRRACLLLSEIDQSVFAAFDPAVCYPVPNKWGTKGATFVELDAVREDMLLDALELSYLKITAKKNKKE